MLAQLFKWLKAPRRIVAELVKEHDFPYLSDIHHESFSSAWSDGELQKLAANDANLCLVAREKGMGKKPPLGFLMVQRAADEAEILTIATAPSERGNGVARHLVDEAVRRLQSENVISLFLEVDENNLPALSLYRKLGFHPVGQREGYYQSGVATGQKPSTALVMRLDLG